jgi:TolB-like protein
MRKAAMNYLRTAILLAGLTALFMGVGYLVEGRVRIAGQLIDVVTGAPWADRFERDFADVFSR